MGQWKISMPAALGSNLRSGYFIKHFIESCKGQTRVTVTVSKKWTELHSMTVDRLLVFTRLQSGVRDTRESGAQRQMRVLVEQAARKSDPRYLSAAKTSDL